MAKRKKTRKSGSMLPVMLLLVIMLPVVVLMIPTTVLLFIALLPTLVSLIVDSNPRHGYKWVCIFGFNFTGTLPFLFDLWLGVNDLTTVYNIFMSPTNVIIIYGCAAIGWLLYVVLPPVISSIITHTDRSKVGKLRKEQEQLVKKWGDEVAGG